MIPSLFIFAGGWGLDPVHVLRLLSVVFIHFHLKVLPIAKS